MTAQNTTEILAALALKQKNKLANDLKAIPEDKRNICMGGCTHSALYMTAECAGINRAIVHWINKGEWPPYDHEKVAAALSEFVTLEKTLLFLDEQTMALADALKSVDPNTLNDEVDSVFLGKIPRLQVLMLPLDHMSYHDGQLNFIQSLLGDQKMHWGD